MGLRPVFVVETPQQHWSDRMQAYVSAEQQRDDRQWVGDVLRGAREADTVVIRTDEFVLLPDAGTDATHQAASRRKHEWLCLVTDAGLRSLRDLRACHLPMLRRMQLACTLAVQCECGVPGGEIMAFVNYPPSVHTLHVHFCVPFRDCVAYDAFRMHSLVSIIANLTMDDLHYAKCHLHFPVLAHGTRLAVMLEAQAWRPAVEHPLRRAMTVWQVAWRMMATTEIHTTEIQTTEIQTTEIQTTEIQTNEIQTTEIQTTEIQTNKIQTNKIQTTKIQTNNTEIQTPEIQTIATGV